MVRAVGEALEALTVALRHDRTQNGVLPVNYIDQIAEAIKREVKANNVPADAGESLFRLYAVLTLAKGTQVTAADVHNAWSAWKIMTDPSHEAIKPFVELSPEIQAKDEPYVQAIQTVARRLGVP